MKDNKNIFSFLSHKLTELKWILNHWEKSITNLSQNVLKNGDIPNVIFRFFCRKLLNPKIHCRVESWTERASVARPRRECGRETLGNRTRGNLRIESRSRQKSESRSRQMFCRKIFRRIHSDVLSGMCRCRQRRSLETLPTLLAKPWGSSQQRAGVEIQSCFHLLFMASRASSFTRPFAQKSNQLTLNITQFGAHIYESSRNLPNFGQFLR